MGNPLSIAEPVVPTNWAPSQPEPSWFQATLANVRTTEDDVATVQEKRRFEAYRDLEDTLVERGVPRESLRFSAINPWGFLGVADAPVASRVPNPSAIWKAAEAQGLAKLGVQAKTQAEFDQWVLNRKGATQRDQEVADRGGFGTGLIGGVVGSFTDPVNVLTLPLGGGGKTIMQVAAREALLNGGLEFLQTPDLIEARKARGEELTFGEGVMNIASAALGGAVLGGGGKFVEQRLTAPGAAFGLDRVAARTLEKAMLPNVTDVEIARAFDETIPGHVRTPAEIAALNVINRQADLDAANPFGGGARGAAAHADRLDAAFQRLDGNATPPTPKRVARGGGVASDVVDFFRAKGYSDAQARGIAAGIHAEASSNHNAVNSKYGAYGLGQWLGSRRDELFRRYGPRPTRDQQLEFLHWELQGGDPGHGGRAVLGATNEAEVLDAYIRKFMRPARGSETDRDLARGMAALGRAVDEVPEAIAEAVERSPDMDGPRVAIEGPELVEIDAPALNRNLFPDDASWRAAQDAVDAETLGLRTGTDEIASPRGEVRATVSAEDAFDLEQRSLGPSSLMSFLPERGEPGVQVIADDGHFATAVMRSGSGRATGAVQVPISAEAREIQPEVLSYVRPDDRRKGVATQLYDALRAQGYPVDVLSGAGDLTPDGAAFVNARRQRQKVEPWKAPSQGVAAMPQAGPDSAGVASVIAAARRDLDAKRYSDPAGADAQLQADRLMHDLKLTMEEDSRKYRVADGKEGSIKLLLETQAEDDAAISALKGCL